MLPIYQLEREAFFGDVTWEEITKTWVQSLNARGVFIKDVFKEADLPINDTGDYCRHGSMLWQLPNDIDRNYASQVAYLNENDHAYISDISAEYQFNRGQERTAELLYYAKDSPSELCAIMFTASMRGREFSMINAVYPDYYPNYHLMDHLCDMALQALADFERLDWHHASKKVLPELHYSMNYSAKDVLTFVKFMANEHVENFKGYRIVNYKPGDSIPQNIIKMAAKMVVKRDGERKKFIDFCKKQDQQVEMENKIKTEEGPEGETWDSIDKEALEYIVWSSPTVKVAKFFGVSDSAVSKRCKKLGITKPPRGFWRRVESGCLPHPNGHINREVA